MKRHARRAVVFAAVAVAFFATGCNEHAPPAHEPLPLVSPLPSPAPHAPIASVAPSGDVDVLAQIRVRFSEDLIPLERLESADESAVLARFSIQPALPGRFRFLTPRMIGFEGERAWPAATRIRVTVHKGLADVHGRALADDVSWTFQTPGIALDDLPGKFDLGPADLRPKIDFTANIALDRTSLEAHARIREHDGAGDGVALTVPADTASPTASPAGGEAPDDTFDPSQHTRRYVLVPAAELAKGKRYDIVISPGVLPRDGNLPSDRKFTGRLHTHDELRFAGLGQNPGRFAGGDPKLTFTTPIDPASLAALSLHPAPPKGSTPFAALDRSVNVNVSLLAPNTSYTVTMSAALRDTFGQTLGAAQVARFTTGDLAPDVWAPAGTNLFASSRDVRLNVFAVNAPPNVQATFRALHPADVVQYPDPNGYDKGDVLGDAPGWPRFDVRGARNVERTIDVPLRAKLGAPAGVLAYGVRAELDGHEEPFLASGAVQLTDLGVFAQFFPDGGTVRVNRISDGGPAGGAQVEVYPSQADSESKSALVACASATTDPSGLARLRGDAFARCAIRDKGENNPPSLVTIVRLGSDWTYVRTNDATGAYSGDLYNGWSSATPIARGTIFSDRSLYQPGETAEMTATGWFLVNGALRRGTAPSYAVTLELPNGDKHDLGRRSLDAFGRFTLPVALAKTVPLGNYTVRATAGNGEEIAGSFRVAEFKPPNFKVDLVLDHAVAQRGATIGGTSTSAYLFGAPLAGASTKFTVTRSPADFTPKGRDAYSFGRRWFWPEQQPDAATDVLESTVTDDAGGKATVSIPIASDLPYPMTYQVDAETTDASNIAVADAKPFTALPSQTLIGLKTDDVGTAGTPLALALVATDATGAARSGANLHVELQRATYASATQIVEGAEQPVESVSYATVANADVVSAAAPATLSLTPDKPGTYRVRAVLAGATDAASETDVQVFVGGSGATDWYARDPNTLTVKLDKDSYKPGETATALVQSPFPNAELHVAVVRHGVLWETTQQTRSAAPTVRFTVTPQMLPNAAVQAFIVRRGAPPPAAPANGANPLARVGFAAFGVALDGKYLAAKLSVNASVLAPGARQTVRVHLTDLTRNPVRGELTLMVVNDAVLQLTGYRPPDLVKEVYALQPISTRYADNRSAIALGTIPRPLEKGWGFGGGLSSENADPRVRRTFQALAFFGGALRTDANGDATVTFTLPDDLTTWRVMVVGASTDGRFGNGETTFRTTQPLVANPVVPQFARPGDRFDAGVAVTNGTGAGGTLHVDGSLLGPLAFLQTDKPAAGVTLDTPLDRSTKAYRFPMLAGGTGDARVTFRIRGAHAADAFDIPMPVRERGVSESVVQSGTTDARASVSIAVAADTPRDAGGMEVTLASSLIPEVTVAARDALAGEERIALSVAARLAIASDLVILAKRSGTGDRLARDRAAVEIATLHDLRRADGGFAPYWRDPHSDSWDSLFVLAALGRARDAGLAVDATVYDGARAYAANVLGDPTRHVRWCETELCKAQLRLQALDALAAAGDRRTTFLAEIDAQRAQLDFADQIRLARLLAAAPGFGARAASLAKTIDDHLYDTGRGAVVNLPGRYAWFEAPVVAQAQALQLELARRADGETIDRLTRSLLNMRRNGSFGCACQTAAALDAIVAVASRERPTDFTATATLAGTVVLKGHFNGARAPQRTATVAMRSMPAGTRQLALAKDGSGTLHYAVTYSYRIAGAAPGRLNGLRVTRVVREANTVPVAATMGLAAPAASFTVAPARVLDIELQIVSDHPVERVVITDALPAGFEAVDTTFATTSKALKVPVASWSIGDQRIRTDRIEAYADRLDAGIYRLHYLARTVTPGTFAWPGAEAHLADRPEEFGRSAASVVTIK